MLTLAGPCRAHLMDLATAIPHALRQIAHWRMTEQTWESIAADPEFRGYAETTPRYACPTERRLFGLLVHTNGRGSTVDLIIPASCLAGEAASHARH